MSQVRIELTGPAESTPEIENWLRECETLIHEKAGELQQELLLHGACYLVVDGQNMTATEINLRRMTYETP